MITISVQGYLTFKALVGKRQVSIPSGSLLQDLLDSLREDSDQRFVNEAYSTSGRLKEHIAVMLNGKPYRILPDGVRTVLKDGDQVAIFPPIIGG
jgi:molybdopterin converting factor small subunit